MSEFKFKIGDLVQIVVNAVAIRDDKSIGSSFSRQKLVGQVVEQLTQTCHGGTQKHYYVRLGGVNVVDKEYSRFVEMELEPYAPPA